jgi:hypothetical protein
VAIGASAARNGEPARTRSVWYGCNLTRSHSSRVSAPGSATNDAYREILPTKQVLEGGIPSYVNDAQGKRELLPPESGGVALAIPALGETDEQAAHKGREAEAVAQHLRNLTQSDKMSLMTPNGSGQSGRDPQGARRQPAAGAG